jgi:hypothetical protein
MWTMLNLFVTITTKWMRCAIYFSRFQHGFVCTGESISSGIFFYCCHSCHPFLNSTIIRSLFRPSFFFDQNCSFTSSSSSLPTNRRKCPPITCLDAYHTGSAHAADACLNFCFSSFDLFLLCCVFVCSIVTVRNSIMIFIIILIITQKVWFLFVLNSICIYI